jgi:hypothetical protein
VLQHVFCYYNFKEITKGKLLISQDIDVNEHEKYESKGTDFVYCCSTFHSHSRVFNNQHNAYPEIDS